MPLEIEETNPSTEERENNSVPKRKNNKLTQSDIDKIKFIYSIQQLSREEKIEQIQKEITIKKAYLLHIFRKLKNKQLIDKSVVKRGRKVKYHANTSKRIAELIIENNRRTDKIIAECIQREFGIRCSRSTIQRLRNSKEIMAKADLKPITIKVYPKVINMEDI